MAGIVCCIRGWRKGKLWFRGSRRHLSTKQVLQWRWCLWFWQMRGKDQLDPSEWKRMKFRSSLSQLLHCFTFSKADTSEWEGVEKLQLCMMFDWDKKEVKRSKRWELHSSGFYSVVSTELDKPRYLLDYWVFRRRRQYSSAPWYRIGLLSYWCLKGSTWLEAPMSTQERSISILFGGSFPLLSLDLSFYIAKRRSPILFEFPFFLNSLTKSYVVANFYFNLIFFKVLQSMGWWLDIIDSKIAKPQVWFWICASLWNFILCDS